MIILRVGRSTGAQAGFRPHHQQIGCDPEHHLADLRRVAVIGAGGVDRDDTPCFLAIGFAVFNFLKVAQPAGDRFLSAVFPHTEEFDHHQIEFGGDLCPARQILTIEIAGQHRAARPGDGITHVLQEVEVDLMPLVTCAVTILLGADRDASGRRKVDVQVVEEQVIPTGIPHIGVQPVADKFAIAVDGDICVDHLAGRVGFQHIITGRLAGQPVIVIIPDVGKVAGRPADIVALRLFAARFRAAR